jgi:hypothetical protein
MSAWRKVFLRNGLFMTACLTALGFLLGSFPGQGWPFGLSETMNQVLTFAVLIPVWFAMLGGGMCFFRWMLPRVATGPQKGRILPVRGPRWLVSYLLEVDVNKRLRHEQRD